MSPEYQKAWRKEHPNFSADQTMVGLRRRVHKRLFAVKGDMSASEFIEKLLDEKKENVHAENVNERMQVPVSREETYNGKI